MKRFISLFLIFGISFASLAQEITVTTKKETPKTTAKTVKPKPKVKPKAKPKALVASKSKTKPKAKPKSETKSKITTIEAATKDGKPITLKSNGTWQYSKPKPAANETQKPKETQKPVVKEVKKPVVKETQKPIVKEVKKPIVKETQKPVAKETQKPVVKEVKNPVAKALPATCNLALQDSPKIRRLQLGMSRSDADRIIPSSNRANFPGSSIIAYPKISDAGFENVESIMAQFFNGTLSGLTIDYDSDSNEWKNAKEFADNLSANFNLPSKYWKFDRKITTWSKMQCRDFSITLNSSENEITLETGSPVQKTAQDNSKRKETFKP